MKIEFDYPDYDSDLWFIELGLSFSTITYSYEGYKYLFSIGLIFFSINIRFK